jgi:hypothetical protein
VADRVELIIQLPAGSSIAERLRDEPPASVADGRVVVQRLTAGADGRLAPPEVGEIVLSVPSPEALRRESIDVAADVAAANRDGGPLTVIIEAAEFLRDDELEAVLVAAAETDRVVILRIMEGVRPE